MMPLINDGYILAVDSAQTDTSELNNKIVIAWHKDMGLIVSACITTTIRKFYSQKTKNSIGLF